MPCKIALIEAQEWVQRDLRSLLALGDVQVTVIGESELNDGRLLATSLAIIGGDRDDPRRTLQTLERVRDNRPELPVMVLAWSSSEQLAISALKQGVCDYFAPPIDLAEVVHAVRQFATHRKDASGRELRARDSAGERRPIIGDSLSMRNLKDYLQRVAQRDCNTLLLGETGTGKDLIAEAIHAHSPRQSKPFICVNCAAIPDTLIESELFGYERGAFTGATTSTEGKIRQANGGTIFFDEIGEMTPYAQAKILRVIEGKQIQRLGGKGSVNVNVRIIAATNQDLGKLVAEQRFRKDLFFRLNVARIEVPSLRERRDDVADLLRYYVQLFNRQTGCSVEGFTPEALDRLLDYEWPGNVRELKNVVESIFVDPPCSRIDVCHLPIAHPNSSMAGGPSERDLLLEALRSTQWNKSKAAEKLQWSRMTIYRKIAKYKIQDEEDRVQSEYADLEASVGNGACRA